MDVNGSKYHLLHGDRDWLSLLSLQQARKVWWDRTRQVLTLAPKIGQIPRHAGEEALHSSTRRGAALDGYGNLYWIADDEKQIMIRPAGTPGRSGPFWSGSNPLVCERTLHTGDFQPLTPETPPASPIVRGLVVTRYQYLVAGTLDPGGLLVFDLHGGGPPAWIRWPRTINFSPFDMSPSPDGGLWILDRGVAPGNGRFWLVDKRFCVIPCNGDPDAAPGTEQDFQPESGSPVKGVKCSPPAGITQSLAMPLDAQDPVSIIGMANNAVLILDRGKDQNVSVLHYYFRSPDAANFNKAAEVPLDERVTGSLLEDSAIQAHDLAFLSGEKSRTGAIRGSLVAAGITGAQAFQFTLVADEDGLDLALQPPFMPLRGFTGKAVIEAASEALYDCGERWLPVLEQPRARFESEGAFESPVFDGNEPDCVWHRLLLDACIPAGAAVLVKSSVSNDRELLDKVAWDETPYEPLLYRRAEGSELPFHRPFGSTDETPDRGTWELLLQRARGRYLKLYITLRGTGRFSPRIRSLRVYYPRFSYLGNYLPAVYREDAASADFLDRFLANAEGLFTSLEGRIERCEALLDTRSTPSEYLEWLAGWLGAQPDATWDDRRQRLFIDHADLLFRWRGTLIGLRAAVRLALDPCPDESIFKELTEGRDLGFETPDGNSVRIVERFMYREHPGLVLGDPTQPVMLGMETKDTPWEPRHGAAALHQRFQTFLAARYRGSNDKETLQRLNDAWGSSHTSIGQIVFSPLPPGQPGAAADWRSFIDQYLPMAYPDVGAADQPLFREFLARRYGSITRLNKAYGFTDEQAFQQFPDITLPADLPSAGAPLLDWIEFVSLAVPIRRNSHRFVVLVPSELEELPDSRKRRAARVAEIVRLEKPAHTDFDVRLYWALFMAGTARLGIDTILGEGSRFAAIVLGSNYLGQSYLAASHPWGVRDRSILGRDCLSGHFYRRSGA